MTAPSGILDFFVLEASEYIELLDGLVLSGGSSGPNAEAFQRAARALRGSATMARLGAFADLAAALERAARSLRDGSLRWSPALSGAIVGAVDDLKTLVRAARAWGDAESRRASARAAEISGFLPAERPAAASPGSGQTGPAFLASETANIAAGLELLLTGPADASAPSNVLQRLRALRGIAAIRDVPPLPDVLEAADEAIRPLEAPQGQLTAGHRELLEAAAAMLRDAARALRGSGPAGGTLGPLAVSPEPRERFEAALSRFLDADGERARIVPVSDLFFDDAGPHVVSETSNPPTTPADRFRLELVGHGEHLRRLVSDARSSSDPAAVDRSRRALRRTLASVRSTAESFGEDTIADTVTALGEALITLDAPGLSVLTGLAELLSSPGHDSGRLRTELPRLLAGRIARERAVARATPSTGTELPWIEPPQAAPPRPRPSRPQTAFAAPPTDVRARPTMPASTPPAAPPLPAAPAGAGLASLLDVGIASVEDLAERPLSAPVPVEETLVPIESLVYRGEAAWRRALELRDDLRKQAAPPREALEELYDLLDLVTDE
ncbi:MAG: Hpt domain-containing protein [Gemmatimonadota bacterium]|nr:Hpt domain-containing protein [Gemmatimonadota bacterium]